MNDCLRPSLCENAEVTNVAAHFQPRMFDIARFVALERNASAPTRPRAFVFTLPRPKADTAER